MSRMFSNKFWLVLVALLLAGRAEAATLISTASGNINATGTWSVIDTNATNCTTPDTVNCTFLSSEAANTALTTSGVASSTFTPAAETVTAIAVKLATIVAAAPSGTLTVKLANFTSSGNRECSQTVNVTDLTSINSAPAAATADGGWVVLSCSASPNGSDSYTITANTSVAAQVNLFSLTTTNWSRFLVTSGTQANGPAAGDKFYVQAALTGAGTHAGPWTVTVNTTSLTNYGNVANTVTDPSVAIGQYGSLVFGTAASTAYVAEFAGPMVVYNGGTLSVGTSGTPVPATSSATLTMNSTTQGDTGILFKNGGTLNAAGSANGRNVVKTVLTSTATGSSTSTLTTADSTGWLSGDSIAIAGTTASTSAPGNETAILTSNASGTSVPLTAAVTNTHLALARSYTSASTGVTYTWNSGTGAAAGGRYPAAILLNRNVVIQGGSSTTNGYLYFQPNSVHNVTWTNFNQISGKIAGQYGFEADTGPLGSGSVTYSSFTNGNATCVALGQTNTNFGGTPSNYYTSQHNVIYNCATTNVAGTNVFGLSVNSGEISAFNSNWKIDDLTVIHTGYADLAYSYGVLIANMTGQVTNVTIANSGGGGSGGNGSAGAALAFGAPYSSATVAGAYNQFGPFYLNSNSGPPMYQFTGSYPISGLISGFYDWNEAPRFFAPQANGATIDPFFLFDVPYGVYVPSLAGLNWTFRNGYIGYDASTVQNFATTIDGRNSVLNFDNMDLCPYGSLGGDTFAVCQNAAISLMADVTAGGSNPPSNSQVFLRNSSLLNNNSTKTASYPSLAGQESWFGSQAAITQDCASCTPVTHGAWLQGGYISYDTLSHTSGYSTRLTPRVSTFTGYIVGTTLTVTSSGLSGNNIGDALYSNGTGFLQGTQVISGSVSTFTVSQAQTSTFTTACNSTTPCQFQAYVLNGNGTPALPRLKSAPYNSGVKVAVNSGQAAQVCVWIRPSINNGIIIDPAPPWGGSSVTYNGDNPRLIYRTNPYMGVNADTVLATFSGSAGNWQQVCGTLPAAPADGEYEFVVDADQTFTSNAGGSVNVTEWSCTNCNSINGQRYWWNGAAGGVMSPTSAKTGGGLIGSSP